jgi:hypothetical protein
MKKLRSSSQAPWGGRWDIVGYQTNSLKNRSTANSHLDDHRELDAYQMRCLGQLCFCSAALELLKDQCPEKKEEPVVFIVRILYFFLQTGIVAYLSTKLRE